MIKLIVAMDRNGLIGLNGKIPWKAPEDMNKFRDLTVGKTVLMGRKTYDSIGLKNGLPNRSNIVLTRKNTHSSKFVQYVDSLYIEYYNVLYNRAKPNDDLFVIGGTDVYKLFASYIKEMFITVINQKIIVPASSEAVYFPWPAFTDTKWECVYQEMLGPNFHYVYKAL